MKKGAVIALILAGAMSFGVVATAGCKKHEDEHMHAWSTYKSDGAAGHHRTTTCEGHAPIDEEITQHDSGDVCGKCGYSAQTGTVRVSSVTISGNDSVKAGEKITLSAEVLPENADNKTVTWEITEGAAFANIDQNGLLTGTAEGTVTVKATADGKSDTFTVTVKPASSQEVPKKKYTVTFVSDGKTVGTQQVEEGGKAYKPATPEKAGGKFEGWYSDGNPYSFDSAVTGDVTLTAQWGVLDEKVQAYGGYNESLYVEWTDGAPSQATVKYKASDENAYKTLNDNLIRAKTGSDSVIRADIIGVKAGTYDVEITTSANSKIEVKNIEVTAYDRSGYAHFNYSDGVGAYTDDGELKDGALVIYVTDENKNTVNTGYVNGQEVDLTGYLYQGKGGIGWILNNRAYQADTEKYGIRKLCNQFGAVAVRFIGKVNAEKDTTAEGAKVSLIDGLTAYDSTDNGGSEGDNGRMARMTNPKNLTLEGVGNDAEIYGWGFHFIKNTSAKNGEGESFEVRNLHFAHNPEDAIGMEGEQKSKNASSELTASVERCWIHDNTFLPGFCAAPAESDKGDGDGSCDFKRGQYFTLAYNYFYGCHKTNLIGSADYSLQFNITMHHNIWYNCKSRMPLVRNSNVHFYNNYILGDATSEIKNNQGHELSEVISARATAYVFSENNYYDGSKTPVEVQSNGVVKAYGNVYNTCWNGNAAVEATSRTQIVSNTCKYTFGNVDYSKFDTSETLFYFKNGQSDCLLDDAVTARAKCILNAGANDWYKTTRTVSTKSNPHEPGDNDGRKSLIPSLKCNVITPETAVNIAEEGVTTIEIPAEAGTVNGVVFNCKSSKGKGQIVTFTLTVEAEIHFTASAKEDDQKAELIGSDGRVYACKVTDYSGVLPAGTYYITGGDKDKELTISSLEFKSTAGAAKQRIDNLNAAIDALPDPENITDNDAALIDAAKVAYNELNAEEKTAYQSENATRYQKYTSALTAFANYAVTSINGKISALDAVSTATTEAEIRALLTEYEEVKTLYEAIPADKINLVENYGKVTDGIAALKAGLKPYEVKAAIAALPAKADITSADKAAVESARAAYDALTADQKTVVGDITKLTDAEDALAAIAAQTVRVVFDKTNSDYAPFTLEGGSKKDMKDTKAMIIGGTTYTSGTEISSSFKLKLTVAAGQTKHLTLYVNSAQAVKVDGVETAVATQLTGEGYQNCYAINIDIVGTGEEVVISRASSTNLVAVDIS